MTGREPHKNNPYYGPRVIWLFIILVGAAVAIVGFLIMSGRPPRTDNPPIVEQILPFDSAESKIDVAAIDSSLVVAFAWESFDEGMNHLKGTDKFGMLYFGADSCPPCRQMGQECFADQPLTSRLKELVIPIKIETESQKKITFFGRTISESKVAGLFDIPGFPSLVFFDGKNELYLFQVNGYLKPEQLGRILDYLQQRLFEDSARSLENYLSER